MRADAEWNKEHGWTEYNFEQQAIENFFEENDTEEILRVEEIWQAVKEYIKDQVDSILYSPKDLDEQGYRKIYDFLNDKLEEIQEELQDAVNRKYGKSKTNSSI
jgi:hypothetical protein